MSLTERRHFVWKLAGRELLLGERTLLMGVLNVTPDSFSDGGKYLDPDRAFARAIELEEQGADIIDIGAESTRPGSERVSEAEELRRLVPVLKRLRGKLTRPDFRRHLQVGRGGKGAGARRRDHQRSFGPDFRSATGARRGPARRRTDHHAHARHAGNLGQARAAQGRDGDHSAGSGCIGASRGARGRGSGAHRDRSGPRLRQTQRAERGDSGAAQRVGGARISAGGGPVAQIISAASWKKPSEAVSAMRDGSGSDGVDLGRRARGPRARCARDESGGAGGRSDPQLRWHFGQ